jgi:large subunit ribosomal protein L34e
MPRRSLRVRSKKRQVFRLPGGKSGVHYEKEKIGPLHCSRCGRIVSGAPHLAQSEIRKLPASQRRIGRPYGSLLCPTCLQNMLKQAARSG